MTGQDTAVANQKGSTAAPIKRWLTICLGVIFVAIIVFLLFYKLDSWPTVWWDEGWTLSAARNWIEHGFLGNLLDGQPTPPRIPLRFPVAVPVTISMKLFGIGIWQGRLPGAIFTILALALYVYLASVLYNRKTGIAALLFLLFLSPYPFQPIISGRQIMAEMPMMLYLLGGYAMTWLALTRSKYWGIGAAISFGIAIHAKLQVPPFWLVSIAIAIWMSVVYRHRRALKVLIGVTAGSIFAAIIVYLIQNSIMPGSFSDLDLLWLLLNTSVITLVQSIRLKAIYIIAIFVLPEVLAFIWAGWRIIKQLFTQKSIERDISEDEVNKRIMRAAMWGLGISWLIWYAAMSMYWIRYVLPAYFVGLIFVAAYISEHTDNFNIRLMIQQVSALLFRQQARRSNWNAAFYLLAFGAALGMAISTMNVVFEPPKWDPQVAAAYLRNHISADAKIETYESELLFLAPGLRYHVPPDYVSMQLYRRADMNNQYPIDYDPLQTNPDYIVVGPFAQSYGLYAEEILNGGFELDADVGGYLIYHVKNHPINQ